MLAVAAVPLAVAAVLVVEVQLARTRPKLPDTEPYRIEGEFGEAAPGTARRDVVWLGDSTVAGVGASSADTTIPVAVSRNSPGPVRLHGLAVSGARVEDVLDEQVPRLRALQLERPKIYISIGANDVVHLTSKDEFRSTYEAMLDALPDDAEVVLLGVPDMGALPRLDQPLRAIAGWRGRALGDVVREIGQERDVTHVEIARETGPPFREDPDRYFAVDQFHPSDDGYALWVKAVVEATR